MTASLPTDIQQVFERFITTEYVTIDGAGQPIAWPVTPYYRSGDPCIDVTTGLGYPKKANDARTNPRVALLFSDPTGSGLDDPPSVLLQGTADVDDHDLDANRERYDREVHEKLPGAAGAEPPSFMKRYFGWYYTRIYVHVRPERVFVWRGGDAASEPEMFGTHMEEVRSGHNQEPEPGHADPEGGATSWDGRIEELGTQYQDAVLAVVCPDGFPAAARVPIELDRDATAVRIKAEPVGIPLEPGLVCLTAHDHAPDFSWQRNFQVRGDLVQGEDGWKVVPHKLVGGFELPPTSAVARYRLNFSKMMRFRKIAKRELAKRS
jgi:hypothetical protein